MLLRMHGLFSSFVRHIPNLHTRIYASSPASRSDEYWEQDQNGKDKNEDETQEDETNIASMIGPYVSSKQIAFHTEQFDSEHIQKKNKQAFLVGSYFYFILTKQNFPIRMLLKHTKFNSQTVVVTSNLFELLFGV